MLEGCLRPKRRNSLFLSELSVEIVDFKSVTTPTAGPESHCLTRIRHYLCCCVWPTNDEAENPYVFQENDQKYMAVCGLVHVKYFAFVLIYVKTLMFFLIVVFSFIINAASLVRFAFLLAFGIALSSYALLLAGAKCLKFHFIIPFFFVTFIFTLFGVTHFFFSFLDSANTRDTTAAPRMTLFIVQICAIALEIYSLLVSWRLFNYICDRIMSDELALKGVRIRRASQLIVPRAYALDSTDDESDEGGEYDVDYGRIKIRMPRRYFRGAKWLLTSSAQNDSSDKEENDEEKLKTNNWTRKRSRIWTIFDRARSDPRLNALWTDQKKASRSEDHERELNEDDFTDESYEDESSSEFLSPEDTLNSSAATSSSSSPPPDRRSNEFKAREQRTIFYV